MIELTDEIILRIEKLIENFWYSAFDIGMIATDGEEIPKQYANDDIFIEFYNGVKDSKSITEMGKICLPKYIRRELNKND